MVKQALVRMKINEKEPITFNIPYVHVDYNSCPITVAWVRLTPSGRNSKDWHIITIKRYKKGNLIEGGREYLPTKYHGVRTMDDAVRVAMQEDPPRKLKAREGKWSVPLFREFVQVDARKFPDSFIATNSGALS